jgi:hypothetical protein
VANEIMPDEGLDYILNIFPRNGTNIGTLYLGLFKGGSATTTPANTATLAIMGGTFAEVTTTDYPGYARVAIPSTDWSTPAVGTTWGQAVRRCTAAQKSFPGATAAATPSAAINGFFICTVASGTSGVVIEYSNFDDTTGVSSLALGDIIRVTPTLGFGG